jgi:hypothetical protein
MRQNRDLAKYWPLYSSSTRADGCRTNSLQSIRIRCLEGEISRLLTENLELREEILRFQNNVDFHPDRNAILSIKDRLGDKIQELNSLLSELGDLHGASRGNAQRARSVTTRPERNSDLLGEQDDRMPTIVEDKQWPRLSLEYESL